MEVKLTNIIKHFHVAPPVFGKDRLDPEMVNLEATKRGYIVQPGCCSQAVLDFVKSEEWNPNTGFYKTWNDVQSKDRWELFIDQILHYASTYGTDYEGEVYSRNGEPININYNTYTVIEAIDVMNLFHKIVDWLKTGVATSKELLTEMVDYLSYIDLLTGEGIPLDEIKNKEAIVMLCDKMGILPTDPSMMVRYMYYKTFGDPLVIKSKFKMLQMRAWIDVPAFKLNDEQIRSLATVYNRHKPFILGLKENKENVKWVNKVSRLAKKLHKPIQPGFWQNITNLTEQEIQERWDGEIVKLDSMFQCIRLIGMIRLRRTQNRNRSSRIFKIRNGSMFIDHNSIAPFNPFLNEVEKALINTLAYALNPLVVDGENYAKGNVYVKLPKDVELTCPSSEKQFLGNLPFGSKFTMPRHDAFFGVYWRNEWGTHDFDIAFINEDGKKYGWNGDYMAGNQSLVFSGDMTNADPEATEMFKVNRHVPNGIITLNRYNGENGSRYELFFGKEEIKDLKRGYMVDPNNIQLKETGTSDSAQQIVGVMYDGCYYPMVLNNGESRVSSNMNYWESLRDAVTSHLTLKELLLEAGWKIWDPNNDTCKMFGKPALDLSDYTKDKLIELFSNPL